MTGTARNNENTSPSPRPPIVDRLREADFGWSGDASCVDAEIAAEGADCIEMLLETLKRLIEPAPGVARLPAWVYGLVRPAIAKAEGHPSEVGER